MRKTLSAALIAGSIALGATAFAAPASADTPAKNTEAINEFTATVGAGTTIGGLIGTGVGFAAGCVIGGVVTSPTIVFVPLGCLTGGAGLAAAGGVLGTVIVGGPTAVVAGVKMVQVLVTPAPAL